MKSKAAIAGHPIHPMLVAVPIGLMIWALIADIVYLATDKNVMWYDIAFWSGIAAWISALVAALPGFVDLVTVAIKSDAKSLALTHMALNLGVVGLFIVATILMWDHGALSGSSFTPVIILHAIGVGMLGLSGWLGGEMVYRYHLGVVPDDAQAEAEEKSHHAIRVQGMQGR
jgi:uncharacterized membrane protein